MARAGGVAMWGVSHGVAPCGARGSLCREGKRVTKMGLTTEKLCIAFAILVYLLMMLDIGYRCAKNNKNEDDFYLGGRRLGPIVAAMSAEASDMSSWLLMGLPGLAYLTGIADAGWTATGLVVGTYANWLLVAKRLRRYSHVANNAITLPQFIRNRYHDNTNLLLYVSAGLIVLFFIPYTASGFAACGKLFSSLFGVNYFAAMAVSALVIVGYTMLGGFLAASTTDFVQSIVMSLALVIVLVFGISVAGGFREVLENAKELPGYLSVTRTYDPVTHTSKEYGIINVFSMMAWGLGYFGMPHILLRFMAVEDENKLSLSRSVATLWVIISLTAGVLIGVVGLGMSEVGALPMLEGADAETIVVRIADLLSQKGLIAALLAGVILAGILASTMSTADSQLLVSASAVSSDIFGDFFRKKKRSPVLAARLTLLVIAAVAIFLARDPNSSVFSIVSFAWAGFGASFGPVVLAALFWERSNRYGALAGMIAGGGMIFIWKYLVRPMGGFWDIYELLPAFLTALAVNVLVSLLTPAPEKEILEEFARAVSPNRAKS